MKCSVDRSPWRGPRKHQSSGEDTITQNRDTAMGVREVASPSGAFHVVCGDCPPGVLRAKEEQRCGPAELVIAELEARGQLFRTDVDDAACAANAAKIGPDAMGAPAEQTLILANPKTEAL